MISAAFLAPLPESILCYYTNATNQPQVARIANLSSSYFDRTVLPGQSLLFQAQLNAQLEISTILPLGILFADAIACNKLQIDQVLVADMLSHISSGPWPQLVESC
jgi:hypothetical protein